MHVSEHFGAKADFAHELRNVFEILQVTVLLVLPGRKRKRKSGTGEPTSWEKRGDFAIAFGDPSIIDDGRTTEDNEI